MSGPLLQKGGSWLPDIRGGQMRSRVVQMALTIAAALLWSIQVRATARLAYERAGWAASVGSHGSPLIGL
jgi:hypothetical protein